MCVIDRRNGMDAAMTPDYYRHFTVLIGEVDAPACCTTLRTDERYFVILARLSRLAK